MSRDTKIIVAVVVASALLILGTVIAGAVWFVLDARSDVLPQEYAEEPEREYDDYEDLDDDYDETVSLEQQIRELEAKLGPNHIELALPLQELGTARLLEGDAESAVPAIERALRIQERAHGTEDRVLVGVLDLLAEAYAARGNHEKSIQVLERLLRFSEEDGDAVETATNLIDLATAHVRSGNEDRGRPLVNRARQLIVECEARGTCLGDELLSTLTELDFARVERALGQNDMATANRLMHDIATRAARDGFTPCDALVDVVFARVEDEVTRCERLANAGKLEQADRVYETVFRMLQLAESAGECTELVDPYMVSDLTLAILRADLQGGRYAEARGRVDRLARYARGHFARGELRDLVRYDITDVVLELADGATARDDLDQTHRLQRFILQLYTSMGLADGPAMCEVVRTMSDSDLAALEEHLMAEEIDEAEQLVEHLRARYDDYRIRRCAPEMFFELAITIGDHAVDASDNLEHANARRLMTIAEGLCRKGGPKCQRELHTLEQDLRR